MFAMTMSGRMTVELNPPSRELADVVRVLDRLDGVKRFSVVVFPLPDGARLDDINTDSYVSGYLQCAGSSQRLTVELREEIGGEYRQFAIARTPELPTHAPDEVVHWSTFETPVYANEIFTADQAAEVFDHYLRTRSVPEQFHLRPLEL